MTTTCKHDLNPTGHLWKKNDGAIGRSEIQQGTGASFKFLPIDKLTPPQ